MFIKTIFKEKLIDLEILYQNAIYILYILIQQNLLIFARIQGVCHAEACNFI